VGNDIVNLDPDELVILDNMRVLLGGESVRPILYEVICRIMPGVIKDKGTIDLLFTSRGIPGRKGVNDVRPIVCQNPLIEIGELLLNRISQTRI
jgi:hypothetical protein